MMFNCLLRSFLPRRSRSSVRSRQTTSPPSHADIPPATSLPPASLQEKLRILLGSPSRISRVFPSRRLFSSTAKRPPTSDNVSSPAAESFSLSLTSGASALVDPVSPIKSQSFSPGLSSIPEPPSPPPDGPRAYNAAYLRSNPEEWYLDIPRRYELKSFKAYTLKTAVLGNPVLTFRYCSEAEAFMLFKSPKLAPFFCKHLSEHAMSYVYGIKNLRQHLPTRTSTDIVDRNQTPSNHKRPYNFRKAAFDVLKPFAEHLGKFFYTILGVYKNLAVEPDDFLLRCAILLDDLSYQLQSLARQLNVDQLMDLKSLEDRDREWYSYFTTLASKHSQNLQYVRMDCRGYPEDYRSQESTEYDSTVTLNLLLQSLTMLNLIKFTPQHLLKQVIVLQEYGVFDPMDHAIFTKSLDEDQSPSGLTAMIAYNEDYMKLQASRARFWASGALQLDSELDNEQANDVAEIKNNIVDSSRINRP